MLGPLGDAISMNSNFIIEIFRIYGRRRRHRRCFMLLNHFALKVKSCECNDVLNKTINSFLQIDIECNDDDDDVDIDDIRERILGSFLFSFRVCVLIYYLFAFFGQFLSSKVMQLVFVSESEPSAHTIVIGDCLSTSLTAIAGKLTRQTN